MRTHLRAGLLLIGLGAVPPAAAQGVYVPPGLPNVALPPYEIMRVVSSHGLTPVTRPVRRGANYILLATDRTGQQMRVAVNARLGDIVGLRAPIAGEPYGPPIATARPPAGTGAAELTPAPNRVPRPAAKLAPAPNPAPGPAAELAPPPRPVANIPNSRVGAAAPIPPNPDVAPAPPPPAPPPSRAVEQNLPPLPPPPPLPRPRPQLAAAQEPAQAPGEAPAAKPPLPALRFLAPSAKDKDAAGEIE